MIRRIIHIDEEKCNGCGLCANACHEGAIGMVDGKARLLRDDYCDGLGDCLPACPTGAITFVEREAAAYDEAAVKQHMAKKNQAQPTPGGCPGAASRLLQAADGIAMPGCNKAAVPGHSSAAAAPGAGGAHIQSPAVAGTHGGKHSAAAAPSAGGAPIQSPAADAASRLRQWPVQIKLAPVKAPYFDGAALLVSADCTAYAYGNFHKDFMENKITLIGCPKLDSVDYSEKLTQILSQNDIKSVTVLRMEVPCCGGIENAVKKALMNSNKWIPWQVVTISIDGRILEK